MAYCDIGDCGQTAIWRVNNPRGSGLRLCTYHLGEMEQPTATPTGRGSKWTRYMTFPTCSICLWNLTCLQPPLRTGRSLTTGIGAINISDITRGAVALCAEKKEGRLVDYNSIAARAIA